MRKRNKISIKSNLKSSRNRGKKCSSRDADQSLFLPPSTTQVFGLASKSFSDSGCKLLQSASVIIDPQKARALGAGPRYKCPRRFQLSAIKSVTSSFKQGASCNSMFPRLTVT